jgi:hypothetical protein
MVPVTASSSTPVVPDDATNASTQRENECPPTIPEDLSAALLALMMKSQGARTEAAQGQIAHAETTLDRAREEVQTAMTQAAEAEENAGFWADVSNVLGGDVAAIASVVAAAVVIVGTGGVGAPAILALAAAGLSAGSTVGQRLGLDPKACAVLGAAGALLSVAGGNVAGLTGAAHTVATGARLVQAGAVAASGATRIAEGEQRADAVDARADQIAAEHQERDARLRIDLAIGVLQDAIREVQQAKRGAAAISQTRSEMNGAVIARIGAA